MNQAPGAMTGAHQATREPSTPPDGSVTAGPNRGPLFDARGEVSRQAPTVHAPTAAEVSEQPPAAHVEQHGVSAVRSLGQVAARAAAPAPPPAPLDTPDSRQAAGVGMAPEAAAHVTDAVGRRNAGGESAQQSAGRLQAVRSGVTGLAGASVQYGAQGGATVSAQRQRMAASEHVSRFLGLIAERATQVTDLGASVPDRYHRAAAAAVDHISAGVEERTQGIAAHTAQLRQEARSKANAARQLVAAQHAATTAAIMRSGQTIRKQLAAELTSAGQSIDAHETAQLRVIAERYRAGDERFRAAGRIVGGEAVAIGDQMAAKYMEGLRDVDDSFLDGPLTYKRGQARAETAREISKAYQQGLIDEANKQADQATLGMPKDIELARTTARQARASLQAVHRATLATVANAEATALRQARDTRRSLTTAIAHALTAGERTLTQQQVALTTNLRAAARSQAATVEQQANALAAATQDQVTAALSSLLQVGSSIVERTQGAAAPASDELASSLANATAQLNSGVATIQGQLQQGLALGEQQLAQAGGALVAGLATSTRSGLEGANAVAAGLTGSIAAIGTSATRVYGRIRQSHDRALATSATAASGGFGQAVTGVEKAYGEMARGLAEGFAKSAAGLEQGLRGALGKMQEEIRCKAEENADRVPPRWKRVVKWVLIIAVVVVVALVVGPFVIGAVGAALGTGAVMTGIIAGAIVGAATSATIQVINNWEANRPLGEGVAKAALIGAIGGAVGGGFGAYFSQLGQQGVAIAQGAVRQFVANTVVNVATETVINFITTGKVTWESFGFSVLNAVGFGLAMHGASGLRSVQGIQEFSMGAGESAGGAIRTGVGLPVEINYRPTAPQARPADESTARTGTGAQGAGAPAAAPGEQAPAATPGERAPAAAPGEQAPAATPGERAPAAAPGERAPVAAPQPEEAAATGAPEARPEGAPQGVAAPGRGAVKPRAPQIPEGYEGGTGQLGRDLGWPTASSDGTPVSELDLATLREKGITAEWARAEAENYRAHAEFNPNNPTAARRATWLDELADRMSREGGPQPPGSSGGSPPPAAAPPGEGAPAAPPRGGGGRAAGPGEPAEPTPRSPDEIPVIDMPEGTVMFGGERPLTATEARTMYSNSIADTPHREAAIYENADTGERIVVQGTEDFTAVPDDVWTEFAAERLGGRWRAVEHYHPVGEAGVTPPHDRYPSGAGGDLDGAAQEARASGEPHQASIDIVTESGPDRIQYGYDPTAERPYWVDVPGANGTRVRQSFRSMQEYHEWYEQQTGRKLGPAGPEPGGPGPERGPSTPSPGAGRGAPRRGPQETTGAPSTETDVRRPAESETPARVGTPEERPSPSGQKGTAPETPAEVRARIGELPEDKLDRLLARIVRGDAKGRKFGTPRNPRMPTIEEFNPRIQEVRAGQVEKLVTGTRHGLNPQQQQSVAQLSNEELLQFRLDDPISATVSEGGGLSLTGGHHRVAEIVQRVASGQLSPEAVVEWLIHD
jgi:hypothetical protein